MDVANCRGTEAPYVMLSRATSLDGVIILRPFAKSKISCRQSELLRDELNKRLPRLTLQTIARFGDADEVQEALQQLKEEDPAHAGQKRHTHDDSIISDSQKRSRLR